MTRLIPIHYSAAPQAPGSVTTASSPSNHPDNSNKSSISDKFRLARSAPKGREEPESRLARSAPKGREEPELRVVEAEQGPENHGPREPVSVEELQLQLHQAIRRAEQYANDLSNYRRQSERQLARARLDAQQELLAELGDVLRSLERAVETTEDSEDSEDLEAVRTGVALVLRGMRAIYDRHGVERIPTQGHPFDPRLHEAVFADPSADRKGVVVKELSPGFRTEERVLRAAKVSVG